jgi:hydroxyethylthiazole kinase-like sugar kinase family protein
VLQVEEFVGISSSLLINMGTLSSDWLASKKLAAKRVSTAALGQAGSHAHAALTGSRLSKPSAYRLHPALRSSVVSVAVLKKGLSTPQ